MSDDVVILTADEHLEKALSAIGQLEKEKHRLISEEVRLRRLVADLRARLETVESTLGKENLQLKRTITAINRRLNGPKRKPFIERCEQILL